MAARDRIGIGNDVHRLVPGRRLVLGGVEIPYERGLEGWSDADAVVHAVIDALLGAAGLGDIGQHFPPGDAEWKDISSLELLRRVVAELRQKGWAVGNIDTTIIAEAPRLSGYFGRMRREMGKALGVSEEVINVKAGTSEGMGFAGRGEGIIVLAVASIRPA